MMKLILIIRFLLPWIYGNPLFVFSKTAITLFLFFVVVIIMSHLLVRLNITLLR